MANITFNSPQEFMNYINNPANYKQTRKKQYQIWACMPAIGTKVTNVLEQSNYVTDEKRRFVLSGTQGEQWVVDVNKLAKTYNLATGSEITPQSLTQLKSKTGGDVIDWFKVATKSDGGMAYCACFVPVGMQFQIPTSWGTVLNGNRPGIPHGKGDFILCPCVNGQPNLNDRWIVNGKVFADTYDNRGFTDYLDTNAAQQSSEVPKPKTLIMGISSQAGAVVAQKVASEIVGELKQAGTGVQNAIYTECGIKITDIKYDCKAEKVSDDLGKQFLKEFLSEDGAKLMFEDSLYDYTYGSDARRDGLRKSMRFVSCFDIAEIFECQSFGFQPVHHKTRYVIASYGDKYCCISKPGSMPLRDRADTSEEFEYLIVPLDGSCRVSLAERFTEKYVRWIPWKSLKPFSYLISNTASLIKPMLRGLANPVEGVRLVKVQSRQIDADKEDPAPTYLFEVRGVGETQDDVFGYYAVFMSLPERHFNAPISTFYSRHGRHVGWCETSRLLSNIQDFNREMVKLACAYKHGLQELLGETEEQRDHRQLREHLGLGIPFANILALYTQAAKEGSKKLPETIANDSISLDWDEPLKNVCIQDMLIPSDKFDMKTSFDGELLASFKASIMTVIAMASVIKCYERSPKTFAVSLELDEGVDDRDVHFVTIKNLRTSASCSYSTMTGFALRCKDNETSDKTEIDVMGMYKKYFTTGKTLMQIASDCYSNVSGLATWERYITQVILGTGSDANLSETEVKAQLALKASLIKRFKLYSNAAWNNREMPETITGGMRPKGPDVTSETILRGTGVPIKNMLIEDIMTPSDKFTVDLETLDNVTKQTFYCTIMLVVMSASLIKCYEKSPKAFRLARSNSSMPVMNNLAIETSETSAARLILRTENGSCEYSGFSLMRWEGTKCVEEERLQGVDVFDIYKKYFTSGKTLFQVAADCYANVPSIVTFDRLITATLEKGGASAIVTPERIEALRASFDVHFSFPVVLKTYSDAAWDGCCRLPNVMTNDLLVVGQGTPVKNMNMEEILSTRNEIDMDALNALGAEGDAAKEFRFIIASTLMFASLLKCYERSPYTFLLRRGTNGLSMSEDGKSVFLRAGDAYAVYTMGVGFGFAMNEQIVERTDWTGDILDVYKKYFNSGVSLSAVANNCYSKVSGLNALDKYVAKVMSYAGNDKAVKGLLIEGISFYYDCFNVQINPEDCKAFLSDANKDTVRAELHFDKYATESGEKMHTVQSEDTTTLFFTLKDGTLTVRGRRENRDIKRTYRIGDGAGIGSLCARSFIDVCRSLKLHPAKILYSSKALWKNIFKVVQANTPGFYYRLTNLETSDVRSNIDVRIQIATKQGEGANAQFKVLGERTVRVHLNYEAFDMTLNTGATMASFDGDVSGAEALSVLRIKVSLLGASAQTQQEETGDAIMYPYALATYIVQKLFSSYFQTTKKYGGIMTQHA